MTLINVKVAKITDEAEGVRSFLLSKTGFFKLPQYNAGAHIDVHCGEGIIRQYSLCGDLTDRRHFMIAVKQGEPSRGGSDLMHQVVNEGAKLEIGSPRNNFQLDESLSYAVLLAAGIGITPIIAMADRLHALGLPFELHYFSRSKKHTAFRSRLQNGSYAKNIKFHENSDISNTQKILQNALSKPQSGGQVYMCGPGPFMDTAKQIALKNWPSNSIILERFAAKPALAGAPTFPFTIELARSGISVDVGSNETILEVLEANNIDAAFSCEQGVCGTCVTKVLKGEPDHRDSFLSEKQRATGKQMCLCVSRAKAGKIVIDL